MAPFREPIGALWGWEGGGGYGRIDVPPFQPRTAS
jgi:hypothetical protein